MTEHHRAQHGLFREFLGLGLDHQHAFDGAGDDEIELGLFDLIGGRVEDVFAVLEANASGAHRAHEGNARNGQRRRGADHGDDIGVVLQIMAEGGADDLGFVAEAIGEQRTDRTVDQAADQGFLLGRPAFALEEAARNLAGGKCLFLIIDGEREKIDPLARRLGGGGGAKHHGFAIGDQHGAVGLTGDPTRLQGQLPAAPHDFLTINLEHLSSSFQPTPGHPGLGAHGPRFCRHRQPRKKRQKPARDIPAGRNSRTSPRPGKLYSSATPSPLPGGRARGVSSADREESAVVFNELSAAARVAESACRSGRCPCA